MHRLPLKVFTLIEHGLQAVARLLLRWFEGKTAGQVLILVFCLTGGFIGIGLFLPGASENPMTHFEEFRVITLYSVAQLLACASLAWTVYRVREGQESGRQGSGIRLRSVHLWVVISFGFLFLAADDLLLIHEITDKLIHFVGGIEETATTDKIDDFIIALYGVAALAVLWGFRREFVKFRGLWPFFLGAFLCLGATIALDLKLTTPLIPRVPGGEWLLNDPWLGVLEESFKLFGEGFFVAAFYGCFLTASLAEGKAGKGAPDR